jgi:hypothetical protein
MRILRWLLFALLVPVAASAQILAPQINLSGNIGCQGFPCVNTGTLVFTSDANHTMTVQETSAFNIRVTSSVTLTATRNLVAPTGRFPFTIENATTGGQSIQIIGASGTGVTIPNGATVAVWNDGTNYVQIGITGSGTVTNFAAPSGSWPYWLVPMVTNSTSTPSLTVSASAIPTGALAFPSTTVNGQTCTLGSTCTIPTSTYSLGGTVSGSNISFGPGAGTGPTLQLCDGLDGAHEIKFTAGTSTPVIGIIFTFTFTSNRGHNTFPVVSSAQGYVEGSIPFVDGGSSTSYSLSVNNTTALTPGGIYWYYISAP